ncbi:MAG TPA: hypothetical protein PKN48_05495 [Bacteroidales bacterium]|nr:hypothetical protein [Bacteroidales bacterium]
MKKSFFCIVLILFSLVLSSTAFAQVNDNTFNNNHYVSEAVVVYFRISGLNKPEDAALIDEVLIKTGLVVSAKTNFSDGICKVEIKDVRNTDKINEHIRSTWKQIGNEIFVEQIDPLESK